MMNIAESNKFAHDWVDAWNSHNLDKILSHYEDGFRMYSPAIVKLLSKPDGFLEGKTAVRQYWQKALSLYPDLTFSINSVFTGSRSVTIIYEGVAGQVAEVFKFNSSGKIYEAAAHYAR